MTSSFSNVVSLEYFANQDWREGRVVLVGGVFDLLHAGHVEHLKESKEHGDMLVVHVTSDKRVAEKKGPKKPVVGQGDRAKLVSALRYVDLVFVDDRPHYHKDIVSVIKPDVLLLNQEAVSNQVHEYLEAHLMGVNVVVTQSKKINNTSSIIDRIVDAFA